MKQLNAAAEQKKHDRTMAILTFRNSMPIVWNQAPWTVFEDPDGYYLEYGNNANWICCQTPEQVESYIPDFKPQRE